MELRQLEIFQSHYFVVVYGLPPLWYEKISVDIRSRRFVVVRVVPCFTLQLQPLDAAPGCYFKQHLSGTESSMAQETMLSRAPRMRIVSLSPIWC